MSKPSTPGREVTVDVKGAGAQTGAEAHARGGSLTAVGRPSDSPRVQRDQSVVINVVSLGDDASWGGATAAGGAPGDPTDNKGSSADVLPPSRPRWSSWLSRPAWAGISGLAAVIAVVLPFIPDLDLFHRAPLEEAGARGVSVAPAVTPSSTVQPRPSGGVRPFGASPSRRPGATSPGGGSPQDTDGGKSQTTDRLALPGVVVATLQGSGRLVGAVAGSARTDCSQGCRLTAGAGQAVTLVASPTAGYRVSSWGTTACSTSSLTCTLRPAGGSLTSIDVVISAVPPLLPEAPVLVSPAEGVVLRTYPRVTTLEWQAVPRAERYLVEVQCDSCGSTPWVTYTSATTESTRYTFTWVGDNQGRWRVTAQDSAGVSGPSSGFRTFRYDTRLAAPALVSPSSGTVLRAYPRVTTLEWRAAPGAAKYLLEVQCDTCGSKPWATTVNTTTESTRYTFTWMGDNEGRWRVTSVSGNGSRSAPSEFWTFRYRTG